MRVSRNGAYNAVAEGAVPSIPIGRNIRIPRDALASILGINRDQAGPRLRSSSTVRSAACIPVPSAQSVSRTTGWWVTSSMSSAAACSS